MSGVTAALFGVIIGIPCLKLSGPYLALSTLAMGLIFYEFVDKILPSINPVIRAHATEGIRDIPSLTGSLTSFYFLVLIIMIISLFIVYSLSRSQFGLVLKAIKKDEPAAKAMGINTTLYKVITFALSAFFAGLAGSLLAYSLGAISPADVKMDLTTKIISMCIVGGIGTISGSFGGAYFLMFLMWGMNEIARLLSQIPISGFEKIASAYKIFEDIFYYGAIIVFLLFMPNGIVTTIIKKCTVIYNKKKG